MSLYIVIFAVLASALLHSVWNMLVKGQSDKLTMMLTIAIVQCLIALAMVPFLGPPVPEAWPWLLAAAVPHTTYKIALAKAYELGEMTKIYPISRGFSVLCVTVLSVVLLDEALTLTMLAGISLIVVGVFAISSPEGATPFRLSNIALALCLAAGVSVAAYTLLDGIGVRIGPEARSLVPIATFAAWLFILDGIGMMAFMLFYRGRTAFVDAAGTGAKGLLAGTAAFSCFWIAIWALAHAPIALVAALRETSVLFSLMLGRLFLSETVTGKRAICACVTFGGILILQRS